MYITMSSGSLVQYFVLLLLEVWSFRVGFVLVYKAARCPSAPYMISLSNPSRHLRHSSPSSAAKQLHQKTPGLGRNQLLKTFGIQRW